MAPFIMRDILVVTGSDKMEKLEGRVFKERARAALFLTVINMPQLMQES